MLEKLRPQPEDKIIALSGMFRADERPGKVDLGVGVYKDAEGRTPIFRAIKAAEGRVHRRQDTKAYTTLAGDPAFADAMIRLILGERPGGAAAIATPGGTGAVHAALELARSANPDLTLRLPAPTWPNHPAIARHLGIKAREYRYFDGGTVDMDGMLEDIAKARPGDVVLLHGCCHNPTGANPAREDWPRIARAVRRAGATAMVDLAYQGFGDGLEEDALFTRMLAAELPELLIAASCSKNFGIYRERTGVLIALSGDPGLTQANMASLNRLNFSFPPDWGARLVTEVLDDEALRADWQAELEGMREGMLGLRRALADALRARTNSDRFDFVAGHRGMFSRLGLTPEQVRRLREEHAIYMIGDSRMNVAGLNARTVDTLAEAVAKVL
ncbi:aromatic amino acid aminotransferase [Hasllibacter halocynthiae]|uniref:Aromatic amino acid aminotransferase n=1 Tax=Hasllibacter halocynthiae TaxID=595589 RepID=A0A2T0X206_9RHOB|nr:amino acid aminotransferase [Hasllibacter halocynthiae]PRY92925.1 aromatic amino acid aminotransferase [Hasllibacter halocynthiae]